VSVLINGAWMERWTPEQIRQALVNGDTVVPPEPKEKR